MKKTLLTLVVIMAGQLMAFGQDGWNWPEEEAKKATAMEKNALYSDLLNTEDYEAAKKPLDWLLRETPDLNPSIYIQGVKIYENLAQTTTGKRQKNLQDSTVLLYDLRMQYFDDKQNVMNRKAFDAYSVWRERSDKYKELYELVKETFELLGNDILLGNTRVYMDAVRRYKLSGGEISNLEIIDIYDQINSILDYKLEQGESAEKIDKYRDFIDKLFNATVTIDCTIIDNQLYPKFQESKDLKGAKRIIKFALAGGCTSSDAFIEAAKYLIEKEPDFGIIRLVATRSKSSGDYEMAEEYFNEAIKYTEDNMKQADIYIDLADIAAKQGRKSEARAYARKALEADPSRKEAYAIIGDLYLRSFEDCKGGKDIVVDRAVYLAAYKMYERAANAERMAMAKEQFPSKEDLFNYNYNAGQTMQVNCWINETVTLTTRD
ncbi:tetratricopeptide repeat protein [Marivirga sp. S37H4]|uniref:Tetratricopeptide repeat protein n=1 Tax=Marivirga aurantiaca TaxID=2802615 RepID=A0A934WZ34_9BACT|nr:tetratricopeptide repeat protein [Marivirga aurantiaca]MBK6265551.1 tetratricopeptide repeat protein [Marivirga aurantiaca]